MQIRLLRGVMLVAFIAAGVAPLPAMAGSSNPNPSANPQCPFGPGKARWDVKTSIAQDQDPSKLATLAIGDLIVAPDLQVAPTTVAAAKAQAAMVNAGTLAAAPKLVAHMRWSASHPKARPAQPPGPNFLLSLPPISPAVLQRANVLVQRANPDEAPPTFFDALLSAQLNSARIPQPVAIGAEQFHEGDLVTVTGFVVSSTCEHDDGDFHIDLSDAPGGTTCAIVEVPNPTYIAAPDLSARVAQAQTIAKTLAVGSKITVSGQLFYDATHTTQGAPGGGRGVKRCAQSLWEVHPVFDIVVG